MLFNSFAYLIFFPIVVALYFVLPYRFRWIFLLLASYYFYMCWKWQYVVLLMLSTLVDYFAGLQMGKHETREGRRPFLIISLLFNLGLLGFFKYFNFFTSNLQVILDSFNILYILPESKFLLPVGISFYTFQSLSYTIDIYRGVRKPEKHLGIFAAFITFFPQLVAGPIERSTTLIPQFYEKHDFDYDRVVSGLRRILWGFFKKLVIADHLALVVNAIYNNPTEYSGLPLWIATFFFAFQVYCDFSGYADIAIGSAQVMGFRLSENFRQPYLAKSIPEFWRRWHITLSSWIQDYVYGPLTIRLRFWGLWGILISVLITFVLIGFWHGASWTFIVFGFLHGLAMGYDVLTRNFWKKAWKGFPKIVQDVCSNLGVFGFWLFTIVFFRANSIGDAVYILSNAWNKQGSMDFIGKIMTPGRSSSLIGVSKREILLILMFIVLIEVLEFLKKDKFMGDWLSEKRILVRWAFYAGILTMIVWFGKFTGNEFVYFAF